MKKWNIKIPNTVSSLAKSGVINDLNNEERKLLALKRVRELKFCR